MDGGSDEPRLILKDDAFMPGGWHDSIVIMLAGILINMLVSVSPMTHVRRRKFPEWRNDPRRISYTKLAIELWTFFLLALETTLLAFIVSPRCHWIWVVVAAWCLVDVLGAAFRDVVVASSLHRDREGPFILVQDPVRWLLMAPLGLLQVVLCHAILFLCFGQEFGPKPITDPLTALYQSMVTFTTLGFGDYVPQQGAVGAKLVIISELSCFMVFVATKLPLAVAITRVRGGGTGDYSRVQTQREQHPAE